METQGTFFAPERAALASDSHDTALCIVPPRHLWASVDRLRALYDKGYEKWPPHINVLYPFVGSDELPKAADLVTSHLKTQGQAPFHLSLDAADVFPHRRDNTIFIKDSDGGRSSQLESLRTTILESLGLPQSSYQPHMTVGQTEDIQSALHHFILQKVNFLPAVQWEVDELCILVRERRHIDGKATSEMKCWGSINLRDLTCTRSADPSVFYDTENTPGPSTEYEAVTETGSLSRCPFVFTHQGRWEPARPHETAKEQPAATNTLTVASYNVLAEFEYPPSQSRYPTVVRNMLERSALADVLVLQEATDDFLCYLLGDERIRERYSFTTCGPPDQIDMEPLPSHLNVVVLSRHAFTWDWVSFRRKHKGAVVMQFDNVGKMEEDVFIPVILATVHLTCGLTDGSVAVKKIELQAVLNYLSNHHAPNPWVLAGDFNITTSTYTIENALKKKAISPQTARYLGQMETLFSESGLLDTWTLARLENVDSSSVDVELFEGEGGATFDPSKNELAAEIVGSGFNNRPQRYDRILVKDRGFFTVVGFNMFGQSPGDLAQRGDPLEEDPESPQDLSLTYGSDHWGIRCSLKLLPGVPDGSAEDMTKLLVPVELHASPASLSDTSELKKALGERGIFPDETETQKREKALALLRSVLQDSENDGPKLSLVVVPVGSYGLGVWTASSDIDCLAIGPINSRIFFALATQRLRKAASSDIKILRRVQAHSGTMLELEVEGVKMDLQYCPSTYIAETWPQAMSLPANSSVFSLSTQTLAKLKPARDLFYLRRTIPDLAAFRTAYHLVKSWAKQRGIYAGKFGYLNGIQISVMLSRVCKLLSRDGASVAVPTILTTFFHHYANFDWGHKMVFDPFFHKRLRYVRTAREPLAILGFHSPNLNTALAASLPSVRTIAEEFRRADKTLSEEGMTWSAFLGDHGSDAEAGEFLQAYKSYVKIDTQFWGVSLAKGSQFVGWLESRCVMLLVDLGRRLPKLHARIWPKRFVDMESSREEKDYQGYYLIGLDWLESAAAPATMSKEDAKIALGSLQTALQKFEEQIRGDEKYFDAKTSWMSASVVRQTELGSLKADDREWGEYTIGDDISDDEDEEEEDDLLDEDDTGSETERPKAKSKRPAEKKAARPAYEGKFRPSADVLNRVRWDPEIDSSDFIVGYEDRFLGAKERALDLWKSEQTDEEFIPQHRILYFKRKSDGVVVWDRKARIDTVFGTGVSSNQT